MRPIFLKLKRLNQDWDIKSLSEAILYLPHIPPAVSGCRDRITLFIDALDENQNQHDNNTLLSIFEHLNATYKDIRAKPYAPVLKICLASRPWPMFRQRLGEGLRVPSFAIHDFTMKDIKDYTNSRLLTKSHMLKKHDERQKAISQLSSDIASRANGVFIWVRIVADSLSQDIIDGTPIESLRGILQEYPEELDEMYKFTLKRVRRSYRPETMIVFKVMLASRVSLTLPQLYTVTNICMGSSLSVHDLEQFSVDLRSWMASSSGGLIDVMETDAGEQRSIESVCDVESTHRESASNYSIEPNLHAKFLHQTVQDFVRNGLDDSLDIAKTNNAVAQLSGSRLLALACLDSHPPHPLLWNVAKDIFSYIRDVEREEDEMKSQQMACLAHWTSFDLHDFPFKIRHPQGHTEFSTREMFSAYLDLNNELAPRLTGQLTRLGGFFDGEVPKDMVPFVVAILHNLYRTRGPKHASTLVPKSPQSLRRLLLFVASVGPRLSKDRLDRPRMFRHILNSYSYALPLQDEWTAEEYFPESFLELPFEPINDLFECVPRHRFKGSLAAILVALKPSNELDDDTLLSFAESLDGEGYKDTLTVDVLTRPESWESLSRDQMRVHDRVRMTLSAFASRFRETNRSKWVGLFYKGWDDAPPDLQVKSGDKPRPFVDLAAWDAMGREPPRHVYTTASAAADVMLHGFVPQTVASAAIPAVVVGLGSSRVFKAFYPGT